MADDSVVTAPYVTGTAGVEGLDRSFVVAVNGMGSESLVGLGIARRLGITLDHGQRLIIEP